MRVQEQEGGFLMECSYCGHYMTEVDIDVYECHNPECPNYLGGF